MGLGRIIQISFALAFFGFNGFTIYNAHQYGYNVFTGEISQPQMARKMGSIAAERMAGERFGTSSAPQTGTIDIRAFCKTLATRNGRTNWSYVKPCEKLQRKAKWEAERSPASERIRASCAGKLRLGYESYNRCLKRRARR